MYQNQYWITAMYEAIVLSSSVLWATNRKSSGSFCLLIMQEVVWVTGAGGRSYVDPVVMEAAEQRMNNEHRWHVWMQKVKDERQRFSMVQLNAHEDVNICSKLNFV